MSAYVCSLFEGTYHLGLGALVNSLYRNGFRGPVFAGYRGALPSWANPTSTESGTPDFDVGGCCRTRFLLLDTASSDQLQTDLHAADVREVFEGRGHALMWQRVINVLPHPAVSRSLRLKWEVVSFGHMCQIHSSSKTSALQAKAHENIHSKEYASARIAACVVGS